MSSMPELFAAVDMATLKKKRLTPIQLLNRDILIACPHCHECATIQWPSYERATGTWKGRCSCTICGKQSELHLGGYGFNDSNPHRYLHLWLQTQCKGKVLWAFNKDHLELLEEYVGLTLRKRPVNHNSIVVARLPRWILSAKNREVVLRAIRRLKSKLPTP